MDSLVPVTPFSRYTFTIVILHYVVVPLAILLLEDYGHLITIKVVLVDQEIIRRYQLYSIGRQAMSREVLRVRGDDSVSLTFDGGGQYVTILWMVDHNRGQCLVIGDACVLESQLHLLNPPNYLLT
jgi:hypothetical protein